LAERRSSSWGPLAIVLLCALAQPAALAQAPSGCGSLDNAYGPYDYRTDRTKLPIVDGAHFTPKVEALIAGESGRLGGDLDYTLRAFPNHHRALLALMRYAQKVRSPQPQDLPRPVECYYDRALRFRPDDIVARMIYAKFLGTQSRRADAMAQLARAEQDARDSGLSHHNIGLIYLEIGDPAKARQQAHRAIALGHPATALREELVRAGQWAEPADAAASAAASATSAPSR
jgi:tetratricopeptide (TPR) repeat protein